MCTKVLGPQPTGHYPRSSLWSSWDIELWLYPEHPFMAHRDMSVSFDLPACTHHKPVAAFALRLRSVQVALRVLLGKGWMSTDRRFGRKWASFERCVFDQY